jgi:hypothetical protein
MANIFRWLCSCFCTPPAPHEDVTVTCNNTISGTSALNGEACTEPDVFVETITGPTDPPQCYGGDTDPCGSGHVYRAVFPCAVPGGCAKVHTMTQQDEADIAITAPSGYEDCTQCFTMTVADVAIGEGAMSDDCCDDLNGSHELCFHGCDSNDGALVWATECLPIPVAATGSECSQFEYYATIDVTGFDCAGTYSGDLTFRFAGVNSLGQCIYIARKSGQIANYGTATDTPVVCADNFSAIFQSPFNGQGTDCVWGFGVDFVPLIHRFADAVNPGDYHGAIYEQTSVTTDGYGPSVIVYTRVTDDTGYPDSTLVGTWPTTITLTRRSAAVCGPRAAQRYKSKWRLEYDTALTKWTLRSFNAVEYPIYSLIDANPCNGSPKTLVLQTPTGDSGCRDYPTTLTLTPSTSCNCNTIYGTGCSVNLWRQCGQTTYQYRTGGPLSAIYDANAIDDQADQLPAGYGCCDAGYFYTWSGGDCCPSQKREFFGHVDPWKDATYNVIWELDPTTDPPMLAGSFAQGTVLYCGDTAMVCDGSTHFTRVNSTLEDGINFPLSCCVVADKVMTCNVRYTGTESPQQNAGYDEVTGQEDFCLCNDSCAPALSGTIAIYDSLGNICANQTICYSRQSLVVPVEEALTKTEFPRIGCIRIWDGEKYNVLTQVVYCVATAEEPGLWASDWYCTQGTVEDTLIRQCNPCTAYLGTFLDTTYATKKECEQFPNFPYPTAGIGVCACAEPVQPSCCDGVELPSSVVISDGTESYGLDAIADGWGGSTNEGVMLCGGVYDEYQGMAVTCVDGEWTLSIYSGVVFPSVTISLTQVSCDPFELESTGDCNITVTA